MAEDATVRTSPRDDNSASVTELPTNQDTLCLETVFPHTEPAKLFTYWIDPDLITRWWPVEAEIDARAGGAYHLSWPAMNWHLRGEYLALDAGKSLRFTWRWDHEPNAGNNHVLVSFVSDGIGGTRLTLEHGAYADTPAGRETRRGHLEGWTYFLERLQTLLGET